MRRAVLVLALVAGCVSPVAIEEALLAYDRTLARSRAQLLLLNVARARAGLPIHASDVTTLAATFEFEAQGDVGAAVAPLGGVEGATGGVSLGASTRAAERPTLGIVPLQGEAFTRRLLEPFDARTFEFVHHRGFGVALLLRLMAHAIVVEGEGGARRTFVNDPARPAEYVEFRRRVTQLEALSRRGDLDVGPIPRIETWPLAPDADVEALTAALERGWRLEARGDERVLVRRAWGRVVVADHDPTRLDDAARRALERRADEFPAGFVLVDLRGGGDAWRGWIKLRSFAQVLEFLGRGVDPGFERSVVLHPSALQEPGRTLAIDEGPSPPAEALVAVELHERWLWVSGRTEWDRRGFEVLMHLYHLTTRNSPTGPPTVITVGGD